MIHNFPTWNNIRNNGVQRISRSSRHYFLDITLEGSAAPDTFHGRVPIGIHEFSLAEAVIDRIVRVLRISSDNERATHVASGRVVSRHAHVQTRGPRARTHAGDKSKV